MKAPDMQNFAVVLQNMIDRNAPQDLTPGYRDRSWRKATWLLEIAEKTIFKVMSQLSSTY